jgi:hypothetical protein
MAPPMRSRVRASGRFSRRGDGRLRTQRAVGWRQVQRHFEHRIASQGTGVVAVLVACRDHQQSKTDDVREAVRDLIRRTRVFDAGGQAIGDAKALLDLAQDKNAAIRRQQTAIEFGDNRLAGDR